MIILTESTFLVYAMHHYENPQCLEIEEFDDDIKRFMYVRKLFNKYESKGDLNERLILNHIVVLYNCFGNAATNMLFFQLQKYSSYLKPFLEFLEKLPSEVEYDGIVMKTENIETDEHIKNKLRKL